MSLEPTAPMTLPDISNLPPGTKLGNYLLAGKLGSGGMGTVYLAEQLNVGRKVAIKILHRDRLSKTGGIDKFVAEARRAASLQHNNLVTIHDVGYNEGLGLVFYTMEYVHGTTLYTSVRQRGPLLPPEAQQVMLQVAGAIAHAHRQGIIHRDIKPENIIVDEHGQARVLDLGLATDRSGNNTPTSARAVIVIGTPGWSAPEQMRNPHTVTPAADVFSLGCLYYYLLTASPPFRGETLIDLAVRVCCDTPDQLHQIAPPERGVIEHLMAKDAWLRPQDGRQALQVIAQPQLAASDELDAELGDRQTTSQHRRRRRPRRR